LRSRVARKILAHAIVGGGWCVYIGVCRLFFFGVKMVMRSRGGVCVSKKREDGSDRGRKTERGHDARFELTRHSGSTSSVVPPQAGQQGSVSCSSLLYGCTVDLPAAHVRRERGGREGEERGKRKRTREKGTLGRARIGLDQTRSDPCRVQVIFSFHTHQNNPTHTHAHIRKHTTHPLSTVYLPAY
jgi:hypothetical protein